MTRRVKTTSRRWQTTLVIAVPAADMTVAEHAPTAGADIAPPPGTPATVSADALPTVQQNGVVWSEAVVGNTVYATGSFSETWPAGKTNTSANDTPRANLLAFDITTGSLITSFNHSLNAQGLVVTASPDGTRVYVGGDFTTVDGLSRSHIVFRDGATTPVFTTTAASNFWQNVAMQFTDTGLVTGSTHSHAVRASDAFHNVTSGGTASVTVVAPGQYASDVLNDGANHYWRLGESSGTAGIDMSGGSTLTEGSGVGHGVAGALVGDSNTASTFDGTLAGSAATTTAVPGPNTFSIDAWFKTTSTSGGKIIGFGNADMGSLSSSYDRHLYLGTAGRVLFGVYNNAAYTVRSPPSLNDGQWHYVVGTLSNTGFALYVDGQPAGTNGGTTMPQNYSGFWRIGGDNLAGWTGSPASNNLNATIDEVATYQIALSAAQISQHYADSGH